MTTEAEYLELTAPQLAEVEKFHNFRVIPGSSDFVTARSAFNLGLSTLDQDRRFAQISAACSFLQLFAGSLSSSKPAFLVFSALHQSSLLAGCEDFSRPFDYFPRRGSIAIHYQPSTINLVAVHLNSQTNQI